MLSFGEDEKQKYFQEVKSTLTLQSENSEFVFFKKHLKPLKFRKKLYMLGVINN